MRLPAVLLLVVWVAFPAFAQDLKILQTIPSGVSTESAIFAAKTAFEKRQWTIEQFTAEAVTASLEHKDVLATMHVTRMGDSLVFVDRTSRRLPTGGSQGRKGSRIVDSNVPQRWVNYLAADIKTILASAAVGSRGAGAEAPLVEDAAARLRRLEKLRSDGLVTEGEYASKRAEILEDL